MKAGDLVVVEMRLSDGHFKSRPALILAQMPPFGDWLLCGISSKIHQEVKGFDILLSQSDSEFANTNLKQSSIIRLGFIETISDVHIKGKIGEVSKTVLQKALLNLSQFIYPTSK